MASIVQRNGSYCVVYLYKNQEGKSKQKWETFKTLDEAKKRKLDFRRGSFSRKPVDNPRKIP